MRQFFYLFLILGLVLSLRAISEPICVRNYLAQGGDPCAKYPTIFVYVRDVENEQRIMCTRKQHGAYCGSAKEYNWVVTADGKSACVMNYNQPPIANFCKDLPDLYGYAMPYQLASAR